MKPDKFKTYLPVLFTAVVAIMVAGTLMTLIVYPLDTMKKTAQVNGGRGFLNNYSKLPELAVRLPQNLGLRGMYRGWHLFLLTSVISSYTQFAVYDLLAAK